MKCIGFKVLFIIASILYSANSMAKVIVYKHCNYSSKGYAVKLPVGKYKFKDLKRLGIKNDDISSLRVTKDYSVNLYEHDNFKGKKLSLMSSDSCLINKKFNDKISSIEVFEKVMPSSYFQFRAMDSQKCLDVKRGSVKNRANIQLYNCHNGGNQGWKLTRVKDNEYKVVGKKSKKCLDVASKSTSNNANVHQWSCKNINNQIWIVNSKKTSKGIRYQFVAKHSNKCLTNTGKNNGSNIVQKTCINGNEPRNQLWRLKKLNYRGS